MVNGGPATERMTKVDTAWLRMDSPGNLMMIMGVWTVKPGIDYANLCERAQERLLKYGRFRQRVVQDAAGATWVEDQSFDIKRHVLRQRLPPGLADARQEALQACVGELATQPLDRAHPLWQNHLVENYWGIPIIVRIHHCIADGIALISVTMSLVAGRWALVAGGTAPSERRQRAAQAGAEDWIADTLIKPFADLTARALGAAGQGAARSLGMLRDPQK